jgi:hypothetical protein
VLWQYIPWSSSVEVKVYSSGPVGGVKPNSIDEPVHVGVPPVMGVATRHDLALRCVCPCRTAQQQQQQQDDAISSSSWKSVD